MIFGKKIKSYQLNTPTNKFNVGSVTTLTKL